MSDEKQQKDTDLSAWLDDIYDVSRTSEDDLKTWGEAYSYQGFDRMSTLKLLKKLVPNRDEVTQIIIVCALRGPRRAAETKLLGGKTISSYQIPASGQKGTKGISCQRITAATADLAAYYLRKLNMPKRLLVDCPAHLQFPGAGAIQMPENIRIQHIEFSKKFSSLIGGAFNEQIYSIMIQNAYLNTKLRLFDGSVTISSSSFSSSSSVPHSSPPLPATQPVKK